MGIEDLMNKIQIGINNESSGEKIQVGLRNKIMDGEGIQIGLANYSENYSGTQIGAFCYGGEGNYLQFGAWTVRKKKDKEPWYFRMTPFIGFPGELLD